MYIDYDLMTEHILAEMERVPRRSPEEINHILSSLQHMFDHVDCRVRELPWRLRSRTIGVIAERLREVLAAVHFALEYDEAARLANRGPSMNADDDFATAIDKMHKVRAFYGNAW